MKNWVRNNQEAFERDLLHDFCLAVNQLEEQFARFAKTGTLSFPVLKAMVGEPMNKGILWRIKDKAHHIFRDAGSGNPVAQFLDWTLGYIFHESLKLMEDSHQLRYYTPQVSALRNANLPPTIPPLIATLLEIQVQTTESIQREIDRLQTLFKQARTLLSLYFAGNSSHRLLARLLYDAQPLVRQAFGEAYEEFTNAIYCGATEVLYIEAAYSLMESARPEEAHTAAKMARAYNPDNPDIEILYKAIAQSPFDFSEKKG